MWSPQPPCPGLALLGQGRKPAGAAPLCCQSSLQQESLGTGGGKLRICCLVNPPPSLLPVETFVVMTESATTPAAVAGPAQRCAVIAGCPGRHSAAFLSSLSSALGSGGAFFCHLNIAPYHHLDFPHQATHGVIFRWEEGCAGHRERLGSIFMSKFKQSVICTVL